MGIELAKAFITITADASGVRANLGDVKREVASSLDEVATAADRSGRKMSDSLNEAGMSIRSVLQDISAQASLASGIVSAAFGFMAHSAMQSAAKYEQTMIAFETMMGSTADAAKLLEDLTEFAALTPYEMPEIEQVARGMIMFGESGDQLMETLEMIGNAASGTSSSFSMLGLIFNQIRGVGKLLTQDFRQLSTRGVIATRDIARFYKVTDAEATAMISKGKVSFEDFREILRTLTMESGRFANMMEKQSQSAEGLSSTLSDAWRITMREIGQSMIPAKKEMIRFGIDIVETFRSTDPSIKVVIASVLGLGTALTGLTTVLLGVTAVSLKVVSMYTSMNVALSAYANTCRTAAAAQAGLNFAAGATGTVLKSIGLAGLFIAMTSWIHHLLTSSERTEELRTEMDKLTESIKTQQQHTDALGSSITDAGKRTQFYKDKVSELADQIDVLKNKATEADNEFREAGGALATFLRISLNIYGSINSAQEEAVVKAAGFREQIKATQEAMKEAAYSEISSKAEKSGDAVKYYDDVIKRLKESYRETERLHLLELESIEKWEKAAARRGEGIMEPAVPRTADRGLEEALQKQLEEKQAAIDRLSKERDEAAGAIKKKQEDEKADAVGGMNKYIETVKKEIEMVGMSTEERKIHTMVMEAEGTAYEEQIKLMVEQAKVYTEALKAREKLNEVKEQLEGESEEDGDNTAEKLRQQAAVLQSLETPLDQLRKKFDELKQLFDEGWLTPETYEAALKAIGNSITGSVMTPTERYQAELDKLYLSLNEGAITIETYNRKLEELNNELTKLGEQPEDPWLVNLLERAKTPLEQLSEELDKIDAKFKAGGMTAEQYKKALESIGRSVTDSVTTPMERYRQEMDRLKLLLDRNAISADTYRKAVKKLNDEMFRSTSYGIAELGKAVQRMFGEGMFGEQFEKGNQGGPAIAPLLPPSVPQVMSFGAGTVAGAAQSAAPPGMQAQTAALSLIRRLMPPMPLTISPLPQMPNVMADIPELGPMPQVQFGAAPEMNPVPLGNAPAIPPVGFNAMPPIPPPVIPPVEVALQIPDDARSLLEPDPAPREDLSGTNIERLLAEANKKHDELIAAVRESNKPRQMELA